jgi:hypothetical protein
VAAEQLAVKLTASIPATSDGWAESQSADCFLERSEVSWADIASGRRSACPVGARRREREREVDRWATPLDARANVHRRRRHPNAPGTPGGILTT